MITVDLNADLGEGAGADEAILGYVTSANIACGFHAGGPAEMRRAVRAAAQRGVAIGAHPGLADRDNFGRLPQSISPDEAYELTVYQVGALQGFVRAGGDGAMLTHVKPHGALYQMAAADVGIAAAIARAVRAVDPGLILVGLSGSELIRAGAAAGLDTASEVFADRSYQSDGRLTPRSQPGALITDVATATDQAVRLVEAREVRATDGRVVRVVPDTICLHGDGAHAAEFADAIRSAMEGAGIEVKPLRRRS